MREYISNLDNLIRDNQDYEKYIEDNKDIIIESEILTEHISRLLSKVDKQLALNLLIQASHKDSLNAKSMLLYYELTGDNGLAKNSIIRFSDNKYALVQKEKVRDLVKSCDCFTLKNYQYKIKLILDLIFDSLSNSHLCKYLEPFMIFVNGSKFKDFSLDVDDIFIRLINAIKNHESYSLIRLGDGEGTFLSNEDNNNDKRKIVNIWFGDSFDLNKTDCFKEYLMESILSADCVGVPLFERFLDDYTLSYDNRNYRALCNIYNSKNYFLDKSITSAFIHIDIYKSNKFKELVSLADKVTIITGHDVDSCKKIFSDNYLRDDLDVISIPTEIGFKDRFGYNEYNVEHYPDVFNLVIDKINANNNKGHLYIICAGFLGKYYAHVVKSGGGVALDMGSAIDYMLGFKTRRHSL